MRKITEQSLNAFINGNEFKSGNMKVYKYKGTIKMYLHGNKIAVKNIRTGDVKISNAGWTSPTTKERLNAIIAHYLSPADKIYQKSFVWYWCDGKEFPSNEFVNVK